MRENNLKFEIYLFSSNKVREAVASLQQLAENVQSKTEQVKQVLKHFSIVL